MAKSFLTALSLSLCTLLPGIGMAKAIDTPPPTPAFYVDKEESRVTFNAKQNHTPVTGTFAIDGDINFDPKVPQKGTIDINIPINSLVTSLEDIKTMLMSKEWLETTAFPVAQFKSTSIEPLTGNTYKTTGKLNIHGISKPIEFIFVLDQYSPTEARAHAAFTINRLDYGIGSGQWKATDTVADEVALLIVIRAVK